MQRILSASKDTYITNKIINNTFRATDANVGQAGTLDLFKIHGESKLSGSSEDQTEISRLLLHFDTSPVSRMQSDAKIDINDSTFKCFVKLHDVYGGQTTPENFNLILFPLSKSFDEGSGYDVSSFRDVTSVNFVTASVTSGVPNLWNTAGAQKSGSLGSENIDIIVSGNLSGIMGPAALMGGAFFLGQRYNPLNPKAVNYNPNLQQEINFAGSKGYITNNPGTGLMQYGPGSVLAGQNVASMFGTNSYLGQLEKKKDYFENRLAKGKNINQSKYAQTLDEISEAKGFNKKKTTGPTYGPHRGDQGNNNNNNTSSNTSSSKGSSIGSGHSGSGYQGRSGSHHYKKGGIASL